MGKVDIRTAGSGNIGATNVARLVGKKLGLVTLILDALKGAVPVLVALHFLHLSPVVAALAGLCAFLGHCFPVWLRFRGGKGVATGVGVLLTFSPLVALVGIAVFAVAVAISRKVSLGSLVGAAAVMIAMPLMVPLDVSTFVIGVMFVVLVGRHHSNIRRLWKREELKM